MAVLWSTLLWEGAGIYYGYSPARFVGSSTCEGGSLTLIRGDAYNLVTGQQLAFATDDWPSLEYCTLKFNIRQARRPNAVLTQPASVSISTENNIMVQTIAINLSGRQTGNLRPDPTGREQFYELIVTFPDGPPASQRTLARGPCIVLDTILW